MVDQLNERLQEATFQGADRLLALHHKRGSILGTTPNQLFSCTTSLSICPCLIFVNREVASPIFQPNPLLFNCHFNSP